MRIVVVEVDHSGGSAEVLFEPGDLADAGMLEQAAVDGVVDMWQCDELSHFALAETVDGLFAVAHHEGGVACPHAVFEERH